MTKNRPTRPVVPYAIPPDHTFATNYAKATPEEYTAFKAGWLAALGSQHPKIEEDKRE